MAVWLVLSAAVAAVPPSVMNYQGVLRDNTDRPLTGSHDMTFRFWSDSVGGDEIFVDQHTASFGNAVIVSGGVFNVSLGFGTVSDGSGPGTYTSLSEVFRDYSTVFLAIQVGAEVLSPRVRIVSAGYAMNASYLEGKAASSLLDTTATGQAKAGKLIAGATSGTGFACGVEGYGIDVGGFFKDSNSSGYAYLGSGDYGIIAYGNYEGGYFQDLDSSGYAYVGSGDYGIRAHGNTAGGFFKDSNSSGLAYVGTGDDGIAAYGNTVGGYFQDSDSSGYANVGSGDNGITAYGNNAGGYFKDSDNSGYAYVGVMELGIQAFGNSAGGYFKDSDSSGYANVGVSDNGISAYGNNAGGYFKDADNSGYAYVGYGDYGINAYGNHGGGYFTDSNSSAYAYVGYGDNGIIAYGNTAGGYFKDRDNSGYADVGSGDRGIWGRGLFAGGTFSHPNAVTFWADVSTPVDKIKGTGAVSFVQNHPDDPSKVVVYAAPEGDEVAVYTRGTARLVDGEARVKLGETFALVANPDIGLTAHVTPVGDFVPLSVVEKNTSELLVRGPAGSDAEFDYLVYGLRIGFERHPVVQAKERDAFLPDPSALDALGASDAELSRSSAVSRFEAMRDAAGETAPLDLTRARELEGRINAGRDMVLARAAEAEAAERALNQPAQPTAEPLAPTPRPETPVRIGPQPIAPATPDSRGHVALGGTTSTAGTPSEHEGRDRSASLPPLPLLPVSGPAEAGDVLVLDLEHPGMLRRGSTSADPGVVGIVAGEPVTADGEQQVPVAVSGLAEAHVDASYGAVLAGDLLVTSPTPGHAMRTAAPLAGTVIGKALEPLQSGTGLIKVLVMPR